MKEGALSPSFSLIELLIAVAIIGILSTAIILSLGDSTETADRTILKTDIRTIDRAVSSRDILEETPIEIAERLVNSGGSIKAKVIGSWKYLERTGSSGTNACAREEGVYDFLEAIASAEGVTFKNSGSSVRDDSKDIVCVSTGSNFAVALMVEDGIWWCGSNSTGENFYTTAPSSTKSISPSCGGSLFIGTEDDYLQ